MGCVAPGGDIYVYIYIYMCVCVCVFMYITYECMQVCSYVLIQTHVYVYTPNPSPCVRFRANHERYVKCQTSNHNEGRFNFSLIMRGRPTFTFSFHHA